MWALDTVVVRGVDTGMVQPMAESTAEGTHAAPDPR